MKILSRSVLRLYSAFKILLNSDVQNSLVMGGSESPRILSASSPWFQCVASRIALSQKLLPNIFSKSDIIERRELVILLSVCLKAMMKTCTYFISSLNVVTKFSIVFSSSNSWSPKPGAEMKPGFWILLVYNIRANMFMAIRKS